MKRSPLERRTPLKAAPRASRPRAISPASTAQRAKVAGKACVACGQSPCDPSHLIDRSLSGCQSEWCVVALCRTCHGAYDEQGLDLLPHLEPHYRTEIAHAVEHVGLLATLHRVTNARWQEAA